MRGLVVAALVGLLALAVGAWLVLGNQGETGVSAELVAGPARHLGAALEREDAALLAVDRGLAGSEGSALDGRTERVAAGGGGADEPPGRDDTRGTALKGRVVDGAGRPVADARVYLAPEQGWPGPPLDSRFYEAGSWSERKQTRTDAGGRFGFEGVERGRARLAVRAPGFAPLDLGGVQVGDAPRQALGDLELVPGAILSGSVVDPHGAPVAGAELLRPDPSGLFLFSLDSGSRGALLATSAADGAFRIDTLAPGPWKLLVTTPDHPDLLAEGTVEHAGREVAGLVLRLAPGYSITGRVEAPEGTDWSGLRVRATRSGAVEVDASSGLVPWREAACGDDGSFTVGGLAEQGTHVLRVWEGAPGSGRGRTLSEPVEAPTGARDVVLTLAAPVEITLRAVDAATSRLLEEFSVELLQERGASYGSEGIEADDERRTRDDQGTTTVRFTPRAGAATRTRIRLSAAGYRPWTSEPLGLDGGRRVDLGRVELEPLPVLLVRVVAAGGGAPIEGATVTLRRDAAREGDPSPGPEPPHGREESARTDAEGRARVALVPGRFALLSASREGFAPGAEQPVSLAELPAASYEPAFELRLAHGGAVEVRVVDAAGAAASGTEVSGTAVGGPSHSATQTTDAAGLALFEHLPVGTHRFEVAAPQRPGLVLSLGGEEGERGDPRSRGEVVVTEGGRAQLTLVRPAQGRLRGRITEGSRPLAGAGLRLDETGAPGFVIPGLTDQPWTHTDGAGRYAIGPLEAGRYELVIQHRTRVMDARVALTIVEGDNALDVELPPTGIEGRVSDASGRPLEGAEVRVRTVSGGGGGGSVSVMVGAFGSDEGDSVSMRFGGDAAPAARSDAGGLYRLRGVRADVDLVVTATHTGHRTAQSEPIRLAPGVLRPGVDLVLGPAGRLEVLVRTAAGQPLQHLSVVASWAGDAEQAVEDVSGSTDADGTVVLDGLAPGEWTVLAQPGGWSEEYLARIAPRQVTIVAGELEHLEIDLPY